MLKKQVPTFEDAQKTGDQRLRGPSGMRKEKGAMRTHRKFRELTIKGLFGPLKGGNRDSLGLYINVAGCRNETTESQNS